LERRSTGRTNCFNGYTIIFGGLDVKLVDMNGRIAHQWRKANGNHSMQAMPNERDPRKAL
jgi:hypothetical protein